MTTDQLLNTAKELNSETMNSTFRLSPNDEDWTLYITKSRTTVKGPIDEVLKMYIDEILSYRKPCWKTGKKHINSIKNWTY